MAQNDCLEHLLDKKYESLPLKAVLGLPPSALQGVTDKDAQLLDQAFGIRTIEDMARCKYFLWAQALTTLAAYEK